MGDVLGLMHPDLGGYGIGDVEFVAAFDVDVNKVGAGSLRGYIFPAQQHHQIRGGATPGVSP